MSVDISQLTANLDPQRRNTVKSQYEERATSSTAAFLLCFFLGSTGAHRFYLREWRTAFAHLVVFVVGAGMLIAGLTQTLPLTSPTLAAHPAGLALDVIGLIILLAALVWEIIDLGRIDHHVYQRNLLLAEGIIAGNLLADHTVVDHARQKLDEVTHQAHAAVPALAAGAAVAGAGAALAAQQGFSTVEYTEVSQFAVSASPEQAQHASAAISEGDWSESESTTETLPAAAEGAAPLTVDETVTRTHSEDGAHVTDSYEVDRVGHPSAAEVAGLGAAGLGAAALGAYEAEQHASFDEPTQPDAAHAAVAAEPAAEAPAAVHADDARMSGYASFADSSDLSDVTDAALPAVVLPAADVATHHARPAYVTLPPAGAAAPEPDAPLYLIPEEPVADSYAADPAQPEEQHAGWGEAATAAGVAGAGVLAADAYAHHEAAPVEEAAPVAPPAAAPAAPPAAAPAAESAATPESVVAPPVAPKMKKIRVRRKVVVDGQVVAEEVVEREVPADMDNAEAARQIQAELSHATPEQIAKLAHLSPDDEVQLSQRSEGL